MQCRIEWFVHALGAWLNLPWALAVAALWLSSRSRRQAFWGWLTDENFYKGFGFVGLLWPQRERKRVWPKVMEEAKLAYLERLEKARQYRGGQLPKGWVALVNIRFLLRMAFLVVEMSRSIVITTIRSIPFRKRPRIVNAECHIGARVELQGVAIMRANSRGVLTVGGSLTTHAASAAKDRMVMESHEKQADRQKPEWLSYEEVATYLLNRFARIFGLKFVEGKQNIQGQRSGTTWTIDAKGIAEGNEGFFIVECRRYTTSKQSQEKIGALAYRISDTGAAGGILVSPLGIQEGAAKIAAGENIISVELGENSTATEFALRFLNKIFIGMNVRIRTSMRASATVLRVCANCGKRFHVLNNEILCSDCDN